MTEALGGGEPQGQPTEEGGQGDAGNLGQYAGYLKGVPEQFHGQLLDGFKRTDSYWQNKLNEAQSQYTPYQGIVGKYEPGYLQAAAQMLDELQSNPQQVLPWLAGELGVQMAQPAQTPVAPGGPQGQPWDQGQGTEWTENLPPQLVARLNEIDHIKQLATLAGQGVLEQRQAQEQFAAAQRQAEELAQFDQLLGELGKKYGEFDEDWVLAKIESGKQPEEAVKMYHDWLGSKLAAMNGRNAPRVFGATGGLPSNQPDVTKLDPQQTRQLVAEMINAANRDG